MHSKNLPDYIYIKETNGKYEFFESKYALTRKSDHPYMYRLQRWDGNVYKFYAKPHLNGQFFSIEYAAGMTRILTKEFKTFLILYGFTLPNPEDYNNGPRFTLR